MGKIFIFYKIVLNRTGFKVKFINWISFTDSRKYTR